MSLRERAIELFRSVDSIRGNNRFDSYAIENTLGYIEAIIHICNTSPEDFE